MTRRATYLVVPLYAVAAVALTWPLAIEAGRALPTLSGRIDPLLQAFLVGWDLKALATDPLHLFAVPIFHPEPRALTFMDTMIGEAVVASPVAAASGNLALAYNFAVLASFVLSAWAVYRLARLLGAGRGGAWLGGFLFAFAPYRMSNLSNLNLLHTEFLALALFFGFRFRRRRRGRDLWGLAAVFVAQCYFGWYYAAFLVVMLAIFALYQVLAGDLSWRTLPRGSALGAAVAAFLLVLPIAWPYFEQHRAMPEFHRTLEQSILYSADVLDYARTNPGNRLAALTHWPTGGLGLWPGFVTLALAALALRACRREAPSTGVVPAWRRAGAWLRERARRWGEVGCLVVVGASAYVLSLGPVLQVAGHRLPVPLPYQLLFLAVPGFQSQRAPSRFGVLVLLALVALAALGYEVCRRAAARRRWRGSVLVGGLVLLAGLELASVPVGSVAFPDLAAPPPVYVWLAGQSGELAVLELPAPASEYREDVVHATRELYGLAHGKRLLDGVSGFAPPAVERLRAALQGFPDAPALRAAAGRGARLIVVHYGELDPERRLSWRERVSRSPALVERARFGDDVVYELLPARI